MTKLNVRSGLLHINKRGILLVFPIKNKLEPSSLWSEFFPNKEMNWNWSDEADPAVATLWHLREELSRSDEVVYAKWYQGRATFFSRNIFCALLSATSTRKDPFEGLSDSARRVLEVLEDNSPVGTRQLKHESGLSGKELEGEFTRALRQLWTRLLIVGRGETNEGGFPSLMVGATKLLFEDIWEDSQMITNDEREKSLSSILPFGRTFFQFYQKVQQKLS